MDSSEEKIGMEENGNKKVVGAENENANLQKEGEMSTSSMSENASSAGEIGNSENKIKKSIKFHGWLPDLLDWIKRTELAQTSLSTSSLLILPPSGTRIFDDTSVGFRFGFPEKNPNPKKPENSKNSSVGFRFGFPESNPSRVPEKTRSGTRPVRSLLVFNQYCWPNLHGKVKPRIVRQLRFLRVEDSEGNGRAILEKDRNNYIPKIFQLIPNEDVPMFDPNLPPKLLTPIASTNPPEYIHGFETIKFEFIDDPALQFVQKIVPILKEVTIRFEFLYDGFEDNPRIGPLSQLMKLLAPKANKLEICGNCIYGNTNKFNDLSTFNEHFPDYIYGFQSICLLFCTESVTNLLVKWLNLNVKRDDGVMKTLSVHFNYPWQAIALIDRVKAEFSKSTEPTNFIISIFAEMDEIEEEEADEYQGFKMENKVTGEILKLNCKNPNNPLLIRHKNESVLKEVDWHEQFKLEMNTPKANTTTIVMP